MAEENTHFKLVFYVPINQAEHVKEAIFLTGAGQLGNYSHCSFETKGIGQFKPLSGANPSIGKQDKLEMVEELKVEILCQSETIKKAVEALKKSHPYEEVAYEVYRIEKI